MSSALSRALGTAAPALVAGTLTLTLAPSFVEAQTGGPAARASSAATTVSTPGDRNTPTPVWVREPVGGPKSDKFLRVSDTRGMGETVAALLAIGTSNKNAVILLVQGRNQDVIDDAKLNASLLILDGYDRIGLVIGDGPEDVAYIYSKGFKVTTLTNMLRAVDRSSVFDETVKRIYERDVLATPSTTAHRRPGE